jgi:ATP-binding cassette subfamily F protein uup
LKALELQKIIKSLEEKEERWFELSAKLEGWVVGSKQ